jgi:Carboxypeptidase regulatory-like domain
MQLRAILAVLILTGALRAQTPAAKPGSVDGLATNSVSGEPVKKALVMLQGITAAGSMGKTSSTATTDASGHFHFGNVQPGSYTIIWERDGYMPPGSGLSWSIPRVSVSEEQDVQDVAIKLEPMGAVSGHVLDEDGEPIPWAQVTVLRYFYSSGRRRLSEVAFAQSNDLGEFEAINLQPGRYYFQAEAPPPRNIPPHTRWTRPEEAYPSTFYPNAREASQASGTDVAPGAHVSNIKCPLIISAERSLANPAGNQGMGAK